MLCRNAIFMTDCHYPVQSLKCNKKNPATINAKVKITSFLGYSICESWKRTVILIGIGSTQKDVKTKYEYKHKNKE